MSLRPEQKSTLGGFAAMSVLLGYLGMRFGALVGTKRSFGEGLSYAIQTLGDDLAAHPLALSLSTDALLWGAIGAASVWALWAVWLSGPRNFRAGEEHGTARWATRKEGAAFANKAEPFANIILTAAVAMAIRRPKFDLKHDRNLNVLVAGGSGSGKTRYVVKPNLMQCYGNYFLTDPKGTLLSECGGMLESEGYEVRLFATVDALFDQSLCYNPLAYVRTDAQILSFVNCLIANTNGKKEGSNDPFWENSEKLLYVALIAFLRDWMDPKDYTLPNLLYLLSLAEAKEDAEDYESPLDLLFKQIETGKRYRPREGFEQKGSAYDESARMLRPVAEGGGEWDWVPSRFRRNSDGACPAELGGMDPTDDFALSNYKAFKTAAGKTLKSIIISCNVRLKPIEIREVSRILAGAPDESGEPTGRCELRLDTLGDADVKAALFAVPSDTDRTFSFLHAILMWQTLNVLCDKALSDYGGKLPTLVAMILDEFANIGTVPDIEKAIAVTRSRNISLMLIVQSLAQLSNNYTDDAAKVIRGNCDTQLFLGGTDLETNKEVSEMIGNETVTQHTWSQTKGSMPGYTKNYQTQQRALLDAAEVGLVPRDEALVLIKGSLPIRDAKYALESHPRYHLIDPGHSPVKGIPAAFEEGFDYAAHVARLREAA